MTLRSELIEVMAEAVNDARVPEFYEDEQTWAELGEDAAGYKEAVRKEVTVVLDALVGYLTEQLANAIYAFEWGNHPADQNDGLFVGAKKRAKAALIAALWGDE